MLSYRLVHPADEEKHLRGLNGKPSSVHKCGAHREPGTILY